MGLDVGDIVLHRLLGKEKVIVGVGQDRYLCAYRGDIGRDGHPRPNARLAMHREESLSKIGHHEFVVPVDLHHLCGKEFRRVRKFFGQPILRKEEIFSFALLFTVGVLIVLAFLSMVATGRSYISTLFFQKVDEKKAEIEGTIRKEREAERGAQTKRYR